MGSLTKYDLAPYLPYELKVKNGDKIETINNIHAIETYLGAIWYCKTVEGSFISLKAVRPLLKPLNSFIDIDEITDEMNRIEFQSVIDGYDILSNVNYKAVILMIKHHIDIFGLIDKELAFDSTLVEK